MWLQKEEKRESLSINIDAPRIVALRAKVQAAREEFDIAISCHEVWKPAAYDSALHERIGRSRAANAFRIIRQTLRREMLLAMMRMWDSSDKAVGMGSVANALSNTGIVDALAAECSSQWDTLHLQSEANSARIESPEILEKFRQREAEFGQSEGKKLRKRASDAVQIIRSYEKGGEKYDTFDKIRRLRHEQLAHRQVKPSTIVAAGIADVEIEDFYQDMAKLIRLLIGAVENADYSPEATAELRRQNAALFWAGARGEYTEGHPNFLPRSGRAAKP